MRKVIYFYEGTQLLLGTKLLSIKMQQAFTPLQNPSIKFRSHIYHKRNHNLARTCCSTASLPNMDWTSSPPRTAKIDRRVSLNCHKSQHGKLKSDKSEHTPCVLSLHPCNQTPAFPATLFSSNAIL